jgi:hypothetical protein
MSVAGVRLTDGRLVWVEAGEEVLSPLDRVVVDLDGAEERGRVMVTLGQLLRPVLPSGRLLRMELDGVPDSDCEDLPGADMPPLGGPLENGVVIAIDAVNHTVTIETADGERRTSVVSDPS